MSGLTGNELVRMFGPDNRRQGSGEDFYASTEAIAALAGGAGGGTATNIPNGTTYTSEDGDTFLVWLPNINNSKTTLIDTSTMADGQVIVVKDYNAGSYSNTISALQGDVTIDYQASYYMNTSNGQSINLKFDEEQLNLIIW